MKKTLLDIFERFLSFGGLLVTTLLFSFLFSFSSYSFVFNFSFIHFQVFYIVLWFVERDFVRLKDFHRIISRNFDVSDQLFEFYQ